MMMIAAYRLERLRQRPILRSSLRSAHQARRLEREGTARPEPPASVSAPALPPEDIHPTPAQPLPSGSVFASLAGIVAEEAAPEAPPAIDEAPADPPAADDLHPAPLEANLEESTAEADAPAAPAAPDTPEFDPPLAEIGFGPGMLIRMSQIGVRTTRQLAAADLGELRAALGDISRLVDVEAWIGSAKRRLAAGAEGEG
jgi:hypothetical protein